MWWFGDYRVVLNILKITCLSGSFNLWFYSITINTYELYHLGTHQSLLALRCSLKKDIQLNLSVKSRNFKKQCLIILWFIKELLEICEKHYPADKFSPWFSPLENLIEKWISDLKNLFKMEFLGNYRFLWKPFSLKGSWSYLLLW